MQECKNNWKIQCKMGQKLLRIQIVQKLEIAIDPSLLYLIGEPEDPIVV
jgi:hypothetical protein